MPNERFFCKLGRCDVFSQFIRQIDLDNHQKAKHGGYVCPFLKCKLNKNGTLFPLRNKLKDHIKLEHKTKVTEGEDQPGGESVTKDDSNQSSRQSSSQQRASHPPSPHSHQSETASAVKTEDPSQPHHPEPHNSEPTEQALKRRRES